MTSSRLPSRNGSIIGGRSGYERSLSVSFHHAGNARDGIEESIALADVSQNKVSLSDLIYFWTKAKST